MPADSPFQTIDDFVEAWKADPSSIVIGGGSSPGGPDHLFPMQLAETVGIDPASVQLRYATYDGGGPLTSALLGVQDRRRVLGSRRVREPGRRPASCGCWRSRGRSGSRAACRSMTCPPCRRPGSTWSSRTGAAVLAPPGISEERRDELIAYLEEMHDTPEWQQALEDNGWGDEFVTGDEFGQFLEDEDARRVHAWRRSISLTATTPESTETGEAPRRDLAQAWAWPPRWPSGAVTVWDASTLGVGFADPVGPRVFPYIIGTGMLVIAVLLAVITPSAARSRGRGRRGHRPHPAGERVTVAKLVGVLGASPSPPSTRSAGRSAAGCCSPAPTWSLGSRTIIRDVIVGVVLAVANWYAFYVGARHPLTPGILDGIL